MLDFTPRPHQRVALDFINQRDRCALWAKPGMGKSSVALAYLDTLHNVWGEDGQTLIIAPLRVARDTWPGELKKWASFRGLEMASATGILATRDAALRRDVPLIATNYDNLIWLRDWFDEKKKPWPFTTIIADESTKLKNFRLRQGGVRAQALGKVAHKDVKRFIELTGTPSSNGLDDLWGQIWMLDAGQRLGRTFSAFQQRWFRPVKNGDFNRWVVADHAQAEIQERLSDICLTLDPKDWFDLADPIVNVIEVEMPPSAVKHYKALEKELFTQLASGEEVEVFNAAALTNKCLQLANGAMYLDPARYGPDVAIEVHSAKIEAVESLLGEMSGEPLLLAYHFRSDLARLQKAFPDALNLGTSDGMAAAMRGEGRLWLGHPQSMGHGVDGLQHHCNTVVFFAQDWSLENHDQMIERIGPMRQFQAGLKRNVHVHYLVAKATLDEVVMARRAGKRSVQDELLNYMKEKRR